MKRLFLILPLLFSSASVFAQGFSYTYLDLGYAQGDIENIDGDGYGIGGSLAFTDNFHLIASYSNVELDDFRNFDATSTSLGIGYNTSISDALDLVISASWVNGEVDLGSFGSYDDDGVGISLGLRTWLAEGLELNAGIEYVDFGSDGGDDTGFGLGLLYSITDNFAIGLSGSWTDDPDSSIYGVNARFYFGQ